MAQIAEAVDENGKTLIDKNIFEMEDLKNNTKYFLINMLFAFLLIT